MIRRQLAENGELGRLALIGVMPWHIDPDPPHLTLLEIEQLRFAAKVAATRA